MKCLVILCLLALACTATTCASVQPTPTPAATVETACENLGKMGCADGLAPNCVQVLQYVVYRRVTPVDLKCLTLAPDFEAARACGGVACP